MTQVKILLTVSHWWAAERKSGPNAITNYVFIKVQVLSECEVHQMTHQFDQNQPTEPKPPRKADLKMEIFWPEFHVEEFFL